MRTFLSGLIIVSSISVAHAAAPETVWIEAEHLHGIKGSYWPMGSPELRKPTGHWSISGPGWAAEWNMGGESGFMSIAAAPEETSVAIAKTIEIPADGTWHVWVRYGDWREKAEPFEIKIEQDGAQPVTLQYGRDAIVGEDNEAKLYWGWAFVWGGGAANLKKGPAKVSLVVSQPGQEARQVDAICMTTHAAYRPLVKDRPASATLEVLDSWRQALPSDLEPLAKNKAASVPPASWSVETFNNKGFVYLWNVDDQVAVKTWLSADPKTIRHPWNLRDEDAAKEFTEKYAGKDEIPIFSDPRIVPTFHDPGGSAFKADPKTGEPTEFSTKFAAWLDAHPDRLWGTMMNYHPDTPMGARGVDLFLAYRPRFVGSISGENLGYFDYDAAKLKADTANLKTRREIAEAIGKSSIEGNKAKYQKIYGKDVGFNLFEDVISCLSVGNITYAPLLADWGARTLGYESAAATNGVLSMRWAFIRGLARQRNLLTATYRSCNFGDSATMFSETASFTGPKNLLDNYYGVFSGAGMTWYKFDIWYQYMAGSSMFYHEQGFDEFWKPGGTTAAGVKEVQLSPKGKLVDRFLRITSKDFDRGTPYTPIAFLVDYAHGWEPSPYWPNGFKNYHGNEDKLLWDDHQYMLEQYFWTAFHPIIRESERPITGTNEVFVAGVFGDVFDVIAAYPDTQKWATIDTYPVVIANGEIELTAPEGERLAKYVNDGGTLVVADAHLTGPGLDALKLPQAAAYEEATQFKWLKDEATYESPRFRFKPITVGQGDRALATTPDGKVLCAASDRGKGRLIYLSVPHGMSISRQASPVLPRLIAHVRQGLMPIEVSGDVDWMLNKNAAGWMVTLINPAGQDKPQQGITPTDYRENRKVTIKSSVAVTSAIDKLLPTDQLKVKDNTIELTVPAGDVRIIELK